MKEQLIFFTVLFASLVNTSLFFLASKWGWVEFYEIHRRDWMPKRCEFCTLFWLAILEFSLTYLLKFPFDIFTFLMIIPFALCAAVLSCYFGQRRF